MSFIFLRKTEGERENRGELRLGWEVEWDENDIGQEEDCSTKQEQYDEKTYVWIIRRTIKCDQWPQKASV